MSLISRRNVYNASIVLALIEFSDALEADRYPWRFSIGLLVQKIRILSAFFVDLTCWIEYRATWVGLTQGKYSVGKLRWLFAGYFGDRRKCHWRIG